MINPCKQTSQRKIILLAGLLLCLLHTNIRAETSAEKIFIHADHMQLNIESGHSVYTGQVKMSQGKLVLTGDKVTVEKGDDEIERITVSGKPARYNHITEKGESIEAESEHMVYTSSQNKLVMTINARLKQPEHQVSSQKIIYDTLNKIIIAGDKSARSDGKDPDKKERVNITLTPKKADPAEKPSSSKASTTEQ